MQGIVPALKIATNNRVGTAIGSALMVSVCRQELVQPDTELHGQPQPGHPLRFRRIWHKLGHSLFVSDTKTKLATAPKHCDELALMAAQRAFLGAIPS